MKRKNGLFSILTLFILTWIIGNSVLGEAEELEGTISFSGAWALYPMVIKWGEEFQKIQPRIKIDVAAGGAGKGMVDALNDIVDIGMVSRDIYPAEIEKGAWWISVTKDAVVPTVNENNPYLKNIIQNGFKREVMIDIWITEKIEFWGEGLQDNSGQQIHVYTRSDACGASEIWAKYLGKNQEDLLGIGVYGDPGLAEAVKKDVFGIGYNNINYVYDAKTKRQVKGLRVLPIDLNGNGLIDQDEDFYETRDEIVKAIAMDKYPSPPSRNLHFVSHGKPSKKVVIEFMKWVLTEGQKYVSESGYINLSREKLDDELKKIDGEK